MLRMIQKFLRKAYDTNMHVSDEIVEEFGERCKDAFRKQFCSDKQNSSSIRPSSIGRPLCQLQHEKLGTEKEKHGYNDVMQFFIGDLSEAAVFAVMKAAGVELSSIQQQVSGELGTEKVKGTLDVIIDGQVWDVKTASPYSFTTKFRDFESLAKSDSFGYVAQLEVYSKFAGLPPGGWIVLNKSTGEFNVVDYDPTTPSLPDLGKKVEAIKSTTSTDDIERLEPDVDKSTGKPVFTKSHPCFWCPFKQECWSDKKLKIGEYKIEVRDGI